MRRCNECMYRWKMYSSQKNAYCGYYLDTGMLRDCTKSVCNSFAFGNPERKSRIIFSANYFKM